MLSVKAIYDGKELKFREKVSVHTPHEVIVTFLDDPEENITSAALHQSAMEGGALNFLKDSGEDIYSDDDLKVKY